MKSDHSPLLTVSLATWANQIATIIRKQKEPVILVGHSRSGFVISRTAERVPERIVTLAYLAAFLVRSGETLHSISSEVPRTHGTEIPLAHDGGITIVRHCAVKPTFYNTTDPIWIKRAEQLVSPKPWLSSRHRQL